jgi:hypothetical protein
MRLEPPLSNLFARCMTLCVTECCGIGAYDIHPIHIASFLLPYRGAPDAAEVRQLREQLTSLQANYGVAGASSRGVTLEELNQTFSDRELDDLVDRVRTALEEALRLISLPPWPAPDTHGQSASSPTLATPAPRLVAFVDVDDTLVRSVGAKRIPISAVIQRARASFQRRSSLLLEHRGCRVRAFERRRARDRRMFRRLLGQASLDGRRPTTGRVAQPRLPAPERGVIDDGNGDPVGDIRKKRVTLHARMNACGIRRRAAAVRGRGTDRSRGGSLPMARARSPGKRQRPDVSWTSYAHSTPRVGAHPWESRAGRRRLLPARP